MTPALARLAALGLILATLTACGGSASPPPPGLRVVATTTVLADLVQQVGGDRVILTALVPKGGEVHTFDPRPSDIVAVTNARLVFLNGLGLDDWAERLAGDSGSSATVVRLGELVAEERRIVENGRPNPHLWLDVANAIDYVEAIAAALTEADPAGGSEYRAARDLYVERLRALDREVRDRLAAVPEANRVVVSFHDAFPYFARAYGLRVVGTVVKAPGQDPSAGDVAALIDEIRRTGARAVLAEAQFSADLARTIAGETGATVVADLYTDSLGNPPADTYEGIVRWDVERIVAALGG
jgi:ABC-type Zn uptake system ZnuABC Zn-binding protein ZnuA